MFVTVLGMVIVIISVQYEKASLPIVTSPAGRAMDSRLRHPAKARTPIVVIVDGSVMADKLVQ